MVVGLTWREDQDEENGGVILPQLQMTTCMSNMIKNEKYNGYYLYNAGQAYLQDKLTKQKCKGRGFNCCYISSIMLHLLGQLSGFSITLEVLDPSSCSCAGHKHLIVRSHFGII